MPVSPGITLQVARPAERPTGSPQPPDRRAELKPLPQAPETPWRIEPLQGWHLPLMACEPYLALQPLLQRCLLWSLPERLLASLGRRRPLLPEILVAVATPAHGLAQVLGMIGSSRLNRRGSCWQVEQLRLAPGPDPCGPSRRQLAAALVREAIQRGQGACSWLVHLEAGDRDGLAALREQGFQPQGLTRLWRWCPSTEASADHLPAGLQLRPLQPRHAALLWHLEQAVCPAPLRPMLDRRIDDLLDQSRGRGWMLVDPQRSEAVAGVRWLSDHADGGQWVEFSLHPAWRQLLGPGLLTLLQRQAAGQPLWLRSPDSEHELGRWLAASGASLQGEEILLARSVWRRQPPQLAASAVRRLGAMLEPFQPGRQPVPTPVLRR